MDKSMMEIFLKMALSLAAVIMTFGAGVFIFRKLAGTSKGFLKKNAKNAAKPMEILAFQSLGPGRNVYLMRCLDKKILIGATNTGISHLADIVEEDEDNDDSSGFGSVLEQKADNGSEERGLQNKFSSTLREIARV